MTEEYAGPGERALALVRGAYDLHVHTAPDVLPRSANDVEVARRFAHRGMAGFAIKSHYSPTAGRARLARFVVPEVDVLGSICLNGPVGGLNPLAVEIAAREGARIVWLPTVDAENESPSRRPPDPQGKRPVWAVLQEDLQRTGVPWEPVRVVDGNGRPLPELREVLRVVARHRMVLASGHLSRDENCTVVEEARAAGVRWIVVTHPDFPTQRLSVEDQRQLARAGAWLERCFGTAHSGKISWEELAEIIRAVGAAHSFLSSDLGQVHAPPVEDGLPLLAERLLALGFQEAQIRTMVENTVRIARLEGER